MLLCSFEKWKERATTHRTPIVFSNIKKCRIMLKQVLMTSLAVSAIALLTQPVANAQDNSGQMTIDIEIIEDGETKHIQRTVDKGDTQSIEDILRELDVLDDMDLSGSGEKIEIKVKKSIDGDVDMDRDLDIRMFDGGNNWSWHEEQSGGFLGVYISTVYGDGSDEANGVEVTSVIEGTAAEKAGIKAGDIIRTVSGEPVNTERDLIDRIRSFEAGETVEIGLSRDGKEQTISAELGKRKHEAPFYGKRKMIFKGMEDDDFMNDEIREMLMNEGFGGKDMDDMIHRRMKKIQKFSADPNGAFLGVASMRTCGDAEESGAKISKVYENSTAEGLGLKEGDIIKEMNGRSISSFGDVVEVMDNSKAGETMSITYERDGETFTNAGALKKREDVLPEENTWHCETGSGSGPWAPKEVKEIEVKIELSDCTPEDEAMLSEPAAVNFNSQLKLNSVEFSPNPSNGIFTLDVDLPEQADTRVMIFDNAGRQVYLNEMRNFSGDYRQSVDISDQPNGIYFLIIAQGEKQFTKKIVKQ